MAGFQYGAFLSTGFYVTDRSTNRAPDRARVKTSRRGNTTGASYPKNSEKG